MTVIKETQWPAILNSNDLAAFLRVNPQWPAQMRMRKRGPRWIRVGRLCKYMMSDVEDWLRTHTVASTSDSTDAAA